MVRAGSAEVVGQEEQPFAGLRIFEANAPQRGLKSLVRVKPREDDRLIADQAGSAIDGMRVSALSRQVRLPARDKKAARLVESKQPLEIQEAAIHDVERSGLWHQLIEDIDLVHFAVADVNKDRDIASQIEQRMQLHRRLRATKRRPRKDQTQIDRRRVERVHGLLQIHAKRIRGVKLACHADQALGEVRVDAPIANFVRIRQRAARDQAANAHVIQLLAMRPQARFDVAQTFPISQLRKRQAKKLLEAREALDLVFPVVAGDTTAKRRQRQVLGQLSENQLACVHGRDLRKMTSQTHRSRFLS